MLHRLAILATALIVLVAISARHVQQPATAQSGGCAPSGYCATFSGLPSGPLAYRPPGFDVQVHSRDIDTWYNLETQSAHHGVNCAGYPNQHQTTGRYEDAVFLCNDHVMTAINAGGYGVIYLTPPALLDFSAGEAVVRFDVSTLRTSQRDWIDLIISPYADNLAVPLEPSLPDLNGMPRNAVRIYMGLARNAFCPAVIRNGVEQDLPCEMYDVYEDWLTPDAVRRDTFELRLSRTSLSFGMPAYGRWWTQNAVISPALSWTQGVVQLGHHSYTPLKDCAGPCSANTWHWDNVSINPAAPLGIIRANERYVDTQRTLTFPQPIPTGARLRFAASAATIDLSYNGGATWTRATPQATTVSPQDEFHARSYFVALPPGTSSVTVRGTPSWAGSWIAKDFALWTQGGATPTVTATPTPSPTATPTKTPTPSPTATPTPAYPRCRVQRQASAGASWQVIVTPYPCP